MKLFFFIFLFWTLQVHASTFVGNGGHAGDIEAQVTLKVIQEALLQLSLNQGANENNCRCLPEFEGHAICETLKKLSVAQAQFCSKKLSEQALGLHEETRKISDQGFRWTTDRIQVEGKSGTRDADAFVDFQRETLTVNQDRFLRLVDYERVFLFTHELGHLYGWKGQPVNDEQSIGPFSDKEGGRQFLNAIAAATTMKALEIRAFNNYQHISDRSQGYKSHWIEVANSRTGLQKVDFGVKEISGSSFSYRFQFKEPWGVSFRVASLSGSESILTSTQVREKISTWTVSANYRWFPFEDPLSYLGQSHLVFGLGWENLSGTYELSDGYNPILVTAQSTSWNASAAYFLPLKYNFWLSFTAFWQGRKYSYEIPFRSIEAKPVSTFNFGVSYGF